MVYESSLDGLSEHWRVIDVNSGEVLVEGDLDLSAYESVASPDGSTVAVDGGHRRDRHHRRLEWRRTAPIQRSRCPGCAGSTTPTTGSCWSPPRRTVGSACGTPRRWTCWAPSTRPTRGIQSRPACSSSATLHDVAIASYDGRVYRWETNFDTGPRLRVSDGRAGPDRGGVGGVPAHPAIPRGVPRALAESSVADLESGTHR